MHFATGNVCLEPEHIWPYLEEGHFQVNIKDLWMMSAYIKVDPNSIDKPL